MLTRAGFLAVVTCAGLALLQRSPALGASRIALVCSGSGETLPEEIERFTMQVEHGLLQHGGYTLLSRTRIAEVLAEQGFANSAYADPSTAAQLGRILGATALLIVDLSLNVDESNGAFVTATEIDAEGNYELIEVSTARIRAGGTAEGSSDSQRTTGEEPRAMTMVRRAAIDECAADLVDKVTHS